MNIFKFVYPLVGLILALLPHNIHADYDHTRPNIILIMADDMGWGDTSYNDHPHLKTPQPARFGVKNGLKMLMYVPYTLRVDGQESE